MSRIHIWTHLKENKMHTHKLFAAFLITIIVAVATVGSVLADRPDTVITRVDATFINDFDCTFPLVEQVKGSYRDTLFFDQNGNLIREYLSPQFQGALTVTWINPVTDISLESHETSTIIVYYNTDGSFQKLANQGLTFMVTVPGTGSHLLMDVGRIVIERGKGISFYSGTHQELIGDTAAFCNYLAGP
jgi:hypothetical protein